MAAGDSPIRPGPAPRPPGTRRDMAGRQRQLVLLTRAVRRQDGPDGNAFPIPIRARSAACECDA